MPITLIACASPMERRRRCAAANLAFAKTINTIGCGLMPPRTSATSQSTLSIAIDSSATIEQRLNDGRIHERQFSRQAMIRFLPAGAPALAGAVQSYAIPFLENMRKQTAARRVVKRDFDVALRSGLSQVTEPRNCAM